MKDRQRIEQLLDENPHLWRAGALSALEKQYVTTGYEALDKILPGQGWPPSCLMEFILPAWGVGELRLLNPLMQSMSQSGYWIIWLAPPHIPYAPYLTSQGIALNRVLVIPEIVSHKECLWAMEKLLREKSCGMVMIWSQKISHKALRRLQLAAEAGQSIGVVFRLQQAPTSAAALRLRLQALPNGLGVELIKVRGGSRQQSVEIEW